MGWPIRKNDAAGATLVFPIYDNDGDLVTGAAALDSEISKDEGTFTDVTAEAAETATASGMYSLGLSQAEINADRIATITKTSTTDAKTAVNVVYTSTRNIDDLAFPVVSGNGLDVTAGGAAGIDWGNVENPATAVDLAGTDIQLADTVSVLTGHTVQTGDSFARLGAPTGASVSADLVAIEAQTDDIGVAGAGLTDLGGMSTAMKAEIESEVNDALDTAISELSQGAPTATPTVRTGLMLLYMALRNRLDIDTTATNYKEIFNDAGVVIAKKTLTDDGTIYSEAEMATGP